MSDKKFFTKKKIIVLIGIVCLLIAGIIIWFVKRNPTEPAAIPPVEEGIVEELPPTLTVETPQKISLSEEKDFFVKVSVNKLGNADYPAASASISFDASRLEFLGIKEGNTFVKKDVADSNIKQQLPTWSYNSEQCNKTGIINIMYLDTTGGKNAFCQELLAKEDNVLFRLVFRLRGSARTGDIYDLIVEDAVFAASDETLSLSVLQDTLQIKDGKIVVGD